MKKLRITFCQTLRQMSAFLSLPGMAGLLLISLLMAGCEEGEQQETITCGGNRESTTGRYKVTKNDLRNGTVPHGFAVFYYDDESYENIGWFVFSFPDESVRCSKNPDGMDFRSVIDAWVYTTEWVVPDLAYKAEIEMSYLGRKPITPIATGAGGNIFRLSCSNGWMDLAERDELENIITRFYIGKVDYPDPEPLINYLVDSLKLEIQYSVYWYDVYPDPAKKITTRP